MVELRFPGVNPDEIWNILLAYNIYVIVLINTQLERFCGSSAHLSLVGISVFYQMKKIIFYVDK